MSSRLLERLISGRLAPELMTEDFTTLPLGSLASMSRPVIHCPLCRRRGALERRDDGARRCIHVETSAIHADGMVVEPLDHCEFAGPRTAAIPAIQA